jgi:hypothetical protein
MSGSAERPSPESSTTLSAGLRSRARAASAMPDMPGSPTSATSTSNWRVRSSSGACSALYERLAGRRREELIGRPLFEMFPGDLLDPRHQRGRTARLARARAAADAGRNAVGPLRPPR